MKTALALLVAYLFVLSFVASARAHWQPGPHNAKHAIVGAWCPTNVFRVRAPCAAGARALAVARCESGFSVWARNGQYLGILQMGSWERARFGHGSDPWSQARAAYRYWRVAGWRPWECARIVGVG